ncbi:tripartite tricarboxylate transporter substrate-binding protein [Microbulbifer sp. S227A]|uniref:tripartite tricarboxylate transporter substrate-binding protein n=1 Tax=Microbulbifer sp. S227A TaxID=3415131 RepID=UPI003C7AC0B5
MKFRDLAKALASTVILASASIAQAQDWQPGGPIKMMIAFQPGGGVDTMGRLLAEELGTRQGWEIIPENLAGKGGATMANALKDEPNDGLSIGISIAEAFTYTIQASRDPGYERDDFDYISILTGSQMGIVSKTDRGWATLDDVLADMKTGTSVSFGAMTQKLADVAYLIGEKNGVEFTIVMVKGGKGGMNGVVADDIDIAWAAGVQAEAVRSGDLVNLVSAEDAPLKLSPDAPMLADFGVPYALGSKFVVVAPAGLPDDVKQSYMTAIADILNDPDSKVNAFVTKLFSGPEVVQGDEFRAFIDRSHDAEAALLAETSN